MVAEAIGGGVGQNSVAGWVRFRLPPAIITSTLHLPHLTNPALDLAQSLTPKGVMWDWHPIVRRWISSPHDTNPAPCVVRSWDAIRPRLDQLSREEVAGMRDQQEAIQERPRQVREAIIRRLTECGEVARLSKTPGRWTDKGNVVEEAESLSRRCLLEEPGLLQAFLRSLSRSNDESGFANGGQSPWVQLCARHFMVGIVRRSCVGQTNDDSLRGEIYDNLHIAFSATADAMVTADRWLLQSLEPLAAAPAFGRRGRSVEDLRLVI